LVPSSIHLNIKKPLPVHLGELVAMYDMVLISDMKDGRSIPQASNRVEFRVNPVDCVVPERYHRHMKSQFKYGFRPENLLEYNGVAHVFMSDWEAVYGVTADDKTSWNGVGTPTVQIIGLLKVNEM
jgi:hypothetical protein